MATIVVADDDEDIRDLVVLKLSHGGHQVVAVEDGAAAVQACRTHRPQLAILDVMMPGTSGLDACRAIRADPELAGLPVILLTARTQEDDLRQGVAAGADDYVAKPFSPRDLAERVTEVLRGRGTVGE
jgi:DNA-binding response OmpR family regulator